MTGLRQTLTRRVLPLALLVVLVTLALRTTGGGPGEVTIDFRVGAAAREVRGLEVEVRRGDDPEPVALLRRSFGAGGARMSERHTFELAEGSYRLAITVAREGAPALRVERRIAAEDGAQVRVDLEDDLLAPPG